MAVPQLSVGQTVELNDGRRAVVRFLGNTAFAPGEWVGVELDEPSGKNDGSVKGDRYFDCDANCGMFLRSAAISNIISQARVSQHQQRPLPGTRTASSTVSNGTAAAAAAKSRPSSISSGVAAGINRAAGAAVKRESIGRSPAKSPTKQLTSASASASASATPRTASAVTRQSTVPSAAAKARTSVLGTTSLAGRRTNTAPTATTAAGARSARSSLSSAPARPAPTTRASTTRASLAVHARTPSSRLTSTIVERPRPLDLQDAHSNLSSPFQSPTEDKEHTPEDDDNDLEPQASFAPPAAPEPTPKAAVSRRTASPPPPPPPQPAARTSRSTAAVSTRELEDLQTKLRVLERKRQEDREKFKKFEATEQERDKYASVTAKLQAKLQTQSQELAELRRQLKESEERLLSIENIQAEHDSELEMATLDREMAEETADMLKTEVEALRAKAEEAELELEVLREENAELGREMDPGERTSQGWLQIERSNERLREALLRLRDVTQEQEAELKAQIATLEEENQDFTVMKQEFDDTKAKLLATEADVEDLRGQLEAALGAEDMIEELTDRNMTMQETLEELRATVEDLESLRELNDELEVNHVEAEKQLQEELDFKDTLLGESARRAAQQAQSIEDAEYTISKFRELVLNLQSDLEDMRSSQHITETEAEELSSRSRAMMDLNMKLQISAQKTQVKTIEMELRRLEAEEAAEHLSIVQLFLPDAFHSDRDSVLALLRFKRIAFKANLIHGFVKEKINALAQTVNNNVNIDENTFAACSVMNRLMWIVAMSERFVNSISSCSTEDFARYESALYELEPVERALNNYIQQLKQDEMKEAKVDEELQRSMAVMAHLASLHIRDSLPASADDILMHASLVNSHLESAACALQLSKALVATHVPNTNGIGPHTSSSSSPAPAAASASAAGDGENEQASNNAPETKAKESRDGDAGPSLIEKFDLVVQQARTARVLISKTRHTLTDFRQRSLTLSPSPSAGSTASFADRYPAFTSVLTSCESLALYARRAGETLQTLFGEEGRTEPYTPSEASLALSRLSTQHFDLTPPESVALTTLASHFRTLTDSLTLLATTSADLSNTTEFARPTAPWLARSAALHSRKDRRADAETEVLRLQEVLRDRSLLVRAKEQELEESGVKIEMLEARMADAQKRSAALHEYELKLNSLTAEHDALKASKEDTAEQLRLARRERDDLAAQLAAQAPRKSGTAADPSALPDGSAPGVSGSGGLATSAALERARLRLKSLQSTLRYFGSCGIGVSAQGFARDLEWLGEPLVPEIGGGEKRRGVLEAEARSACAELRSLVLGAEGVRVLGAGLVTSAVADTAGADGSGAATNDEKDKSEEQPETEAQTQSETHPEAGSTEEKQQKKLNRLAWRPVKETPKWIVRRQREDWETWGEWVRDLRNRVDGSNGDVAVGTGVVVRAPVLV